MNCIFASIYNVMCKVLHMYNSGACTYIVYTKILDIEKIQLKDAFINTCIIKAKTFEFSIHLLCNRFLTKYLRFYFYEAHN